MQIDKLNVIQGGVWRFAAALHQLCTGMNQRRSRQTMPQIDDNDPAESALRRRDRTQAPSRGFPTPATRRPAKAAVPESLESAAPLSRHCTAVGSPTLPSRLRLQCRHGTQHVLQHSCAFWFSNNCVNCVASKYFCRVRAPARSWHPRRRNSYPRSLEKPYIPHTTHSIAFGHRGNHSIEGSLY